MKKLHRQTYSKHDSRVKLNWLEAPQPAKQNPRTLRFGFIIDTGLAISRRTEIDSRPKYLPLAKPPLYNDSQQRQDQRGNSFQSGQATRDAVVRENPIGPFPSCHCLIPVSAYGIIAAYYQAIQS